MMDFPSDPLDLEETALRVNEALNVLAGVKWPEFSSVFESSAKANVGTALGHLNGVMAALQEEGKRRASLPPGGDERPAPGTATEFPRFPEQPTHPSRRRPHPSGVAVIWGAVVATVLVVTLAVLLVLTKAGVIGW